MPPVGQPSSTRRSFGPGEYVPIEDAYSSEGTPASCTALATRELPSTFTIHCLVKSRDGWMIQASNTTASAPLRWGTRSSSTTSAAAHSTFGTVRPGNRRAIPRTDSRQRLTSMFFRNLDQHAPEPDHVFL